ncbi:MAG: cobalamin-dependent protein [Anaerosomatales bacterium]|nr:cobalamin-dependent protein [Anaerosomatales bacterium]
MSDETALPGTGAAQGFGQLAERAVHRLYERSPESRQFISSSYQACLEDMEHHARALAVALETGEQRLLDDYATWAKALLAHRGLPDSCLVGALLALQETVAESQDPAADRAVAMLQAALARLAEADPTIPPSIDPSDDLAPMAARYLELLLAGDRPEAMRLVLDAASEGIAIRDLYDRVLRAVQHEVGRLWQSGRVSVAMEHYITGVNQVLMARLYPVVADRPSAGPKFVGACVGGERHELGIRMVCDLLQLEGWDAVCLGADTPVDAIVAALAEHKPAVLGLSATLGFNVPQTRRFIEAARAAAGETRVHVIVGGRPFDVVPDLWRRVGADGYAPSASAAAEWARSLVGGGQVA